MVFDYSGGTNRSARGHSVYEFPGAMGDTDEGHRPHREDLLQLEGSAA